MAILFMDGFDHYSVADITKKWTSSGGTGIESYAANGGTGKGLTIPYDAEGAHWAYKDLTAAVTTIIVGCNINPTGTNTNGGYFMFLRDGTTTQVALQRNASNGISVYRGTTLLGSSAAGVFSVGVWKHLEVKATIDNSTGSVEVRVNGVTVVNLTSQDTQNTGNNTVSRVVITSTSSSGATYYDDFYILDTSGSENNNFLGETRIKTIYPTAEGTNTGWTPLSGTDNALMTDETPMDSDTTYNYTDTVTARDTYAMGDISTLGSSVYGVAINTAARKDGDEVRKIKSTLKSGSTYALGAEVTLGTAYTIYQDIHNLNPDGSVSWTEATVNAIEAGVDLTV